MSYVRGPFFPIFWHYQLQFSSLYLDVVSPDYSLEELLASSSLVCQNDNLKGGYVLWGDTGQACWCAGQCAEIIHWYQGPNGQDWGPWHPGQRRGSNLIEQGELDIMADQWVAYHKLFKRRVRTQTHNNRNLDSQSRLGLISTTWKPKIA